MKQLMTFGILVLFVITLNGQVDPNKIVETFWTDYETISAEETIDKLYQNSPWIKKAEDEITQLKSQFSDLQNLLGKYYDKELLIKKEIGESYAIYIYMAKFDRQPMRFKFEFYKPDKEWNLHSFSYDFDLDDDFETMTIQEFLNQ